MSNYYPVHSNIWNDNKFTEYAPDQQLVFLYLITNPNCKLSGIYKISPKQIYCSTNIAVAKINKILASFDKSTIEYDFENGFIFIKNFFKYNLGKGGNPKIIFSTLENNLNILKDHKFTIEFAKKYEVEVNNIKDKINLSKKKEISTVDQQLDNSKPTVDQQFNKNKDNNKNKNKDKNNKEDEDFEIFWNKYDNKKSKSKALASFKTALKKESFEKIMAGLENYIKNRKPDKMFWKHPASWLNSECWNDEYSTKQDNHNNFKKQDYDAGTGGFNVY